MSNYFDWKYYIERYEDLRKAGILDKRKAIQHWLKFGIKECRICNKLFENVDFKYLKSLVNEYQYIKSIDSVLTTIYNKKIYDNDYIYKLFNRINNIKIKEKTANEIDNENNKNITINNANEYNRLYNYNFKRHLFCSNAFIIGIIGNININNYPILILDIINILRSCNIDAYLIIIQTENDCIELPDELNKELLTNKFINIFNIQYSHIKLYTDICDILAITIWNNYIKLDINLINILQYNKPIICKRNNISEKIYGKTYYGLYNSNIDIEPYSYLDDKVTLDEYYNKYYKLQYLPYKNQDLNNISLYLKKYFGFINLHSDLLNKHDTIDVHILHYNRYSYINTINEYIESFKLYSNHNIIYYDIDNHISDILNIKEGIIILAYDSIHILAINMNKNILLLNFLKTYNNIKICIIQDEYYHVNDISNLIKYINANIILTCLKGNDIFKIYNINNLNYYSIMTGYSSLKYNKYFKKIDEKNIDVFYRGRKLHYYYGLLGQYKLNIGIDMKKYCNMYNITNDIEWDDNKRIYKNEWIEYLANSKTTLATLTGSNVINYDNERFIKINKWLNNTKLPVDDKSIYSYANAKNIFNIKEELNIEQISPKIFEAISVGTVLIMYEDNYSYILKPNIHYISLNKDYSNIEEVINKIKDNEYLQEMANRAYNDIILSEHYSYKKFIEYIDNIINLETIYK